MKDFIKTKLSVIFLIVLIIAACSTDDDKVTPGNGDNTTAFKVSFIEPSGDVTIKKGDKLNIKLKVEMGPKTDFSHIMVYIEDEVIAVMEEDAPLDVTWDTSDYKYNEGEFTLMVKGWTHDDEEDSSSLKVTLLPPDDGELVVTIVEPEDGQTIEIGTKVMVKVTVEPADKVRLVKLFANETPINHTESEPFEFEWDTGSGSTYPSGEYILKAEAEMEHETKYLVFEKEIKVVLVEP